MEEYKAQYYNDALTHYGIKGMRWGVRRKRPTKSGGKGKGRAKNYMKAYGRMTVNAVAHPLRTSMAKTSANRNTKLKRALRRRVVRSTSELNAINADVKKQGETIKGLKKQPKTSTKIRKPQPLKYSKEAVKLGVNAMRHPLMTNIAVSDSFKNQRMRTTLRKAALIKSRELEAINNDIKNQKLARKKRKKRK